MDGSRYNINSDIFKASVGDPGLPDRDRLEAQLLGLAAVLRACHAKAVLLFGSAVAFLEDHSAARPPNDLDILLVCDNPLPAEALAQCHPPLSLHHFRVDQILAIARSLRYDPRPVALAKLYAKNVLKQHARDVIAASILLGPGYRDFGIEQIEIDGLPDPRDYSRHRVLAGRLWWQRLTAWSRERRGLLSRMADKLVGADRFE